MYSILILLAMIVAVLLIVIVLLQSSKGGGLAGTFGGANMGSMFGARRTSDFLSKSTWWLAGALGILAIVINLFFLPGKATSEQRESVIQRRGQSIPTQGTVPQQQQAPKTK